MSAAEKGSWEAVFGHLGATPDEAGNAIVAQQHEADALRDALVATLRALADDYCDWVGPGCEMRPAVVLARAAIEFAEAK